MPEGLVMINTGNGKGKTTAALGQALRALGYGYNVCIIQFIKGAWKYGELFSCQRFSDHLDFNVMGKGFIFKKEHIEEDRQLALKGWQMAVQALTSDKYFLVIFDELTYLLNYGFLDISDVIATLENRKKSLNVMITGRNAPAELIEYADLVTEMKEIKHPFKKGVKAQKGIEF